MEHSVCVYGHKQSRSQPGIDFEFTGAIVRIKEVLTEKPLVTCTINTEYVRTTQHNYIYKFIHFDYINLFILIPEMIGKTKMKTLL